jgi:hypothetical protein
LYTHTHIHTQTYREKERERRRRCRRFHGKILKSQYSVTLLTLLHKCTRTWVVEHFWEKPFSKVSQLPWCICVTCCAVKPEYTGFSQLLCSKASIHTVAFLVKSCAVKPSGFGWFCILALEIFSLKSQQHFQVLFFLDFFFENFF